VNISQVQNFEVAITAWRRVCFGLKFKKYIEISITGTETQKKLCTLINGYFESIFTENSMLGEIGPHCPGRTKLQILEDVKLEELFKMKMISSWNSLIKP
jgi:hypothetical protein